MKIDYIIPTLHRDTLDRAIKSITDEGTNHNIFVMSHIKDGGGCGNRNAGLSQVKDSDWIIFLDDDDYLVKGFSKQLNNDFDVIVFRMSQDASNPYYLPKVIPRVCNKCSETTSKGCCLHSGNVGCNFAIKTSFYLQYKWLFDCSVKTPDWHFLERVIDKTDKIKVTKDIFYIAPMGGYNKIKPNGKK